MKLTEHLPLSLLLRYNKGFLSNSKKSPFYKLKILFYLEIRSGSTVISIFWRLIMILGIYTAFLPSKCCTNNLINWSKAQFIPIKMYQSSGNSRLHFYNFHMKELISYIQSQFLRTMEKDI